MRQVSDALAALLNAGGPFLMADLYTFTLVNGTVLRYTSADTSLTVGGHTFQIGPVITRDKVRITAGLDVDELQITINADSTQKVGAAGMIQALTQGVFDGATVQLERVFMPTWGDTSAGTLILFAGRVSSTECTRWEARLTVRSWLELLDTQIPRMIYQAGCRNALGDYWAVESGCYYPTGGGYCTVNLAEFTVSGAITGALDNWLFHDLSQPTGYFDLGVMTLQSGACKGLARTVKRQMREGTGSEPAQSLVLVAPFPTRPAPGDTFTITPGCDKTLATCQTKFNTPIFEKPPLNDTPRIIQWRERFCGEPFIPAPETVL